MSLDLFAPRGRYGEIPSIASRIDASGDCWLWTGCTSDGYGRFSVNGVSRLAHRVVWELLTGSEAPETLDHLCRVRNCVNPDHLEPVSQRENLLRGYGATSRNARKRKCANGHPFTPENTYQRPSRPLERECRECLKRRARERARES